ncbi:DUF397 domain-containing protein [Streptomyces anulatus]
MRLVRAGADPPWLLTVEPTLLDRILPDDARNRITATFASWRGSGRSSSGSGFTTDPADRAVRPPSDGKRRSRTCSARSPGPSAGGQPIRLQVDGECVEVAPNLPHLVPVRDSKRPTGPVLTFGHAAWRTFVSEPLRPQATPRGRKPRDRIATPLLE